MVLETYGRMGGEFEEFLTNTIKLAWNWRGKIIPLSVLTDYWIKRISVTLQTMNASVLLSRSQELTAGDIGKKDEDFCHDNIFFSGLNVGLLWMSDVVLLLMQVPVWLG